MSGPGNVKSGKSRSGNCPVGDVSVGEVLVEDMSSQESVLELVLSTSIPS